MHERHFFLKICSEASSFSYLRCDHFLHYDAINVLRTYCATVISCCVHVSVISELSARFNYYIIKFFLCFYVLQSSNVQESRLSLFWERQSGKVRDKLRNFERSGKIYTK